MGPAPLRQALPELNARAQELASPPPPPVHSGMDEPTLESLGRDVRSLRLRVRSLEAMWVLVALLALIWLFAHR